MVAFLVATPRSSMCATMELGDDKRCGICHLAQFRRSAELMVLSENAFITFTATLWVDSCRPWRNRRPKHVWGHGLYPQRARCRSLSQEVSLADMGGRAERARQPDGTRGQPRGRCRSGGRRNLRAQRLQPRGWRSLPAPLSPTVGKDRQEDEATGVRGQSKRCHQNGAGNPLNTSMRTSFRIYLLSHRPRHIPSDLTGTPSQ